MEVTVDWGHDEANVGVTFAPTEGHVSGATRFFHSRKMAEMESE